MRIEVGAGARPRPGFMSFDLQSGTHAGELGLDDGSVELIFANAMLEHLYLGEQLAVLAEWRRVLAPNGAVVCLGVPDFESIAREYAFGNIDLYQVYRYSHGDPGLTVLTEWAKWRRVDEAPTGWLPQLHKSLFDAATLHEIFRNMGFQTIVFRYCYPGEDLPISLGVIAAPSLSLGAMWELFDSLDVDDILVRDTIKVVAASPERQPMARQGWFEGVQQIKNLIREQNKTDAPPWRMEHLALRSAHPRYVPKGEDFERVVEVLEPAYREYVNDVSHDLMAISLGSAAYMYWLAETIDARSIIDFGSGFTSYVARLYASAHPGTRVMSVDDDETWLQRTKTFCEEHGLDAGTFRLLMDDIHGPFDLVVYDYAGGEVRDAGYGAAMDQVGKVGLMDDAHFASHAMSMMRAADKRGLELFSLDLLTTDMIGRYSALVVKP